MRSEETFALFQSAQEIRVAIEADGDRIGALLNERQPLPTDEGEASLDYRRYLEQLSAQLGTAVEKAAGAEDEHMSEVIRGSRAQSERDEIAKACYGKLIATRQSLEGLYQDGGFELAFVAGTTPRAPKRLYEQLGQTVKLFRQPAVARRELRVGGFSVDLEQVAADLELEATRLGAALAQVASVDKQAEGALVIKREAIDELHRVVIWVGRTVEGLFQLAGETELAGRIRKATRRPLRPSETTEPKDEPNEKDEKDEKEPKTPGAAVEAVEARLMPQLPAPHPSSAAQAMDTVQPMDTVVTSVAFAAPRKSPVA